MQEALFTPYQFGLSEKAQLDKDGHYCLPGILTLAVRNKLREALARVVVLPKTEEYHPTGYAAEHEGYLAELIAHPQMLTLARSVLGEEIRYDHCVSLSRAGGDPGQGWHSHAYAHDQPQLGFLRIFFYVNGFERGDGALKVVPGSHLFRDAKLRAETDADLEASWLHNKTHPLNGKPLCIEELEVPPGSIILMWTHAAHAVSPRRMGSDTRWSLVYAYRNQGAPSHARWITPAFENQPPDGAEGLMSLD